MLSKFRNLVLYMGLEKEQYRKIKANICESNRHAIIIYSIMGSSIFFCMTLLALINVNDLGGNLLIYACPVFIFLILLILNYTLGNKYAAVVKISISLFIISLLGVGIYLSAVVSPDQRVAAYLAFLVAIATLCCIPPLNFSLIVCLANLFLGVCLKRIQTGDLLRANIVNIFIFGIVSIVIATYLMNVKASRLWSDHLNEYLIEADQMTGLYNRRSYEHVLENYRKSKKTAPIVILDVNRLKQINDTLGHKIGDELICGAANCIKLVFGKYGVCYRIGGDEFAVILNNLYEPLETVTSEFDKIVYGWHGQTLHVLTISYGIATPEEYPDLNIDELVQTADKLMYKAKADFYRATGIDRRRR